MILFIKTSVASELSAAMWALSKPQPPSAEDTQFCFPWVRALDGIDYLEVKTDFAIYVDRSAELGSIADILQPWIDGGQLPADTNTQLAALVESKRGESLVVYDAFPQLFKTMSKTYEQMIDAGLLAEPQMP
jgi:hypothetical protein